MYVSRQNIDMPHIMGIACSGHRVAEAMDLKETDIHWEHGDINIKCYSCHDAVGDKDNHKRGGLRAGNQKPLEIRNICSGAVKAA